MEGKYKNASKKSVHWAFPLTHMGVPMASTKQEWFTLYEKQGYHIMAFFEVFGFEFTRHVLVLESKSTSFYYNDFQRCEEGF